MVAYLTPAQREDQIERAAILEYDAGMDRAEAEALATELVLDRDRRRMEARLALDARRRAEAEAGMRK